MRPQNTSSVMMVRRISHSASGIQAMVLGVKLLCYTHSYCRRKATDRCMAMSVSMVNTLRGLFVSLQPPAGVLHSCIVTLDRGGKT